MKHSRALLVSIFVVGILVVMLSMRQNTEGIKQPTPMPLVLRQVQSLGELHTVRHTYQNVFEHHTAREPQEWTRYIPGLPKFVEASTRNEALVGMTGTIDAGVDLSRARWDAEGRLVLPEPQVYRPVIDAKVHRHRRGALWSDSNIGLAAVSAAEDRLKVAARQQGIVAEAKINAVTQLRTLVPNLAEHQIVFAGE